MNSVFSGPAYANGTPGGSKPWGETLKEMQGQLQTAAQGGLSLKEVPAARGRPIVLLHHMCALIVQLQLNQK